MKRCFTAILASTVLLLPLVNAAKALPVMNYDDFDRNNVSPLVWRVAPTTSAGENIDMRAIGSGRSFGYGANASDEADAPGLFSAAMPVRLHSTAGSDYAVSFDTPSVTVEHSSDENGRLPAISLAGIIAASPIPFDMHGPSKPDMGWLTHAYTTLAFVAGQATKWPHFDIQVNRPCASADGGGPVSTVPLPPALPLLAAGLAALGIFARRRNV